ncbi:MAG: type I-E CRISPR-associated protein Cas5/CasD [Chloroflexales bacterium]|nr:type I-E CRISPR-associated protein Cas5/CasD [Chloroflexales bacterium]
MNTLFLRLEGPLQAWGLRARWGERDTADAPTKSGLLGLLGCAMGMRRDDPELRELSDILRVGVRIDLAGQLLVDYHTTGGATAADGEPEGMLSAEGKRKRETDLSRRHYLADASFLAALQSQDEALIARLAATLQAPVWPCFLGRKACVPATPLFVGLGNFAALRTALEAGPTSRRVDDAWSHERPAALRLLIETVVGQGNRQYDNLGNPERRVFRPRYVREEWWALPPVLPAASAPSPINTLEG